MMELINQFMSNITTAQRRVISIAIAFFIAFSGTFSAFVKVNKDFREMLGWVTRSEFVHGLLYDRRISMADMVFLAVDKEAWLITFFTVFLILLHWAAFALTVYSVLSGNQIFTIGTFVVTVLCFVFSIFIIYMVNSNNHDYWSTFFSSYTKYIQFTFRHILAMIFAALNSIFWFLACEAEEVDEIPDIQAQAMGEVEKLVRKVQQRVSETKKAYTCPHCDKILTKKSGVCNGCGKALPSSKVACHNCQAILDVNAQFCPKCGTKRNII